MYPAAESKAKVDKEPLFVNQDCFFMNVFIREARIEEDITSEFIRTVVATCGCKII